MRLWLAADPLLLASRSKARRRLLTAAGVPVEIAPADVDERALEVGAAEPPDALASRLAHRKAAVISARHPGRWVVGADQTLALGKQRLNKPRDRAAARRQLAELAGRTHELYSAVAVMREGVLRFSAVGRARLTMRAFSPAFLDAYLELAGPQVTASIGGYELEALGVQLMERIEGDHFVILGMPLLALIGYLRQEGCLRA